jgi:pyruvate dehydrogenase E1 component alpha subunit
MSIAKECAKTIAKDSVGRISRKTLVSMYETMLRIRLVEERIGGLISKGKIKAPCHLYIGQEAVATGVCANLKKGDYVFSTHRSHGHYLAKGGDLTKLMAEIYGRVTGCCRGRGGSMHIASPDRGLHGSSAIVGGTIPLAVGAALGFSLQQKRDVAVAFFGDGATNEGVLYESLNFASLKKLPVIFICENNFYSTHMHISKIQSVSPLYKIGELFKIPSFNVNGYNIIDVFTSTKKAVEGARQGKGPVFIEMLTYRWRGHVGPNWDLDKSIRSKEEVYWWVNNCPIKKFENLLLRSGIIDRETKKHIFQKLHKEVREAIDFAKDSPPPDTKELEDVFC